MDFNQCLRMLRINMRLDKPTFIGGPPGVGKSDMVRQIAKEDGDIPVIDFRALLRDPVDLRGLPAIDLEHGVARWLPPSDLPNAITHGERGILLIDEINASPPSMQAACFGLVLDRKAGEYRMPPGWRIVAAGNALSHGGAAQKMPTPLVNRFAMMKLEASLDSTIQYGLQTGKLAPMVMGLLKFRSQLVHQMPTADMEAFPTPRSWVSFCDVLREIDGTDDEDLIHEAATEHVGSAAAGEFVGFRRTFNELPSFDEVIARPYEAKIPTEPSGQYAAASMLSAKVKPTHMDQASIYLERIGDEFLGMFMFDVIKKEKEVFEKTKAFIKWVTTKDDKNSNTRF